MQSQILKTQKPMAPPHQRQNPRIRIQVPVFLRGTDALGVDFIELTKTLNISSTGACIASSHILQTEQVIQLTIPTPSPSTAALAFDSGPGAVRNSSHLRSRAPPGICRRSSPFRSRVRSPSLLASSILVLLRKPACYLRVAGYSSHYFFRVNSCLCYRYAHLQCRNVYFCTAGAFVRLALCMLHCTRTAFASPHSPRGQMRLGPHR